MKRLGFFAGVLVLFIAGCGSSGGGVPGPVQDAVDNGGNQEVVVPDTGGKEETVVPDVGTDNNEGTGGELVGPRCGNNVCEKSAGENCGNCPGDCPCATGQKCYQGECCTPKTCQDLGWECGTTDDGCGGSLDCGTCSNGETCNDGKCEPVQEDVVEPAQDVQETTEETISEEVTEPQEEVEETSEETSEETIEETTGEEVTEPGEDVHEVTEIQDAEIECIPKSCEELGWECGTGDDGCGLTIDCGQCDEGQECQNHKCVKIAKCGDGTCDEGENCQNCSEDCGCKDTEVCTADGKCVACTTEGNTFTVGMGGCCEGLKEISTSKPDDQGKCPEQPPVGAMLCTNCGDGHCDADKGENKCNCPEDCKPVCGDGVCDKEVGENCETCEADCGCQDGWVCYHGSCCDAKGCDELNLSCGLGDDQCNGIVNCGYCEAGKTCQGGQCTDKDDCKGLFICILNCGGDENCVQNCKDKASDVANQQYNDYMSCLQTNNCINSGNIDSDCANQHCYSQSLTCFSGDVYLGCYDLDACIGDCYDTARNQNELHQCILECQLKATPIAQEDYYDLLDCLNTACADKCDCSDTDTRCKQQCSKCLDDAQSQGGACEKEVNTCKDHQPYDGNTCGQIFNCMVNCNAQTANCTFKCLYMGTRSAQRKYMDFASCLYTACKDSCDCEPNDNRCRQNCLTCRQNAMKENGECYDELNSCLKDGQ